MFEFMSLIHSEQTRLTAPAPLESNIAREHAHSHLFVLNMTEGQSYFNDVALLLNAHIHGAGRVDLLQVKIKYTPKNVGDGFRAGITNILSGFSKDLVFGLLSGYDQIANEKTKGEMVIYELMPDDSTSRQIRPTSSELPAMKIALEVVGKAKVAIHFYVKIHGVITQEISVDF
jgi:hypothetical protein